MFKGKLKKIIICSTTVLLIGTISLASSMTTKNIPVTYGSINFTYNGEDVTKKVNTAYDTPAFISEDRSYAPVRAIADIVGVSVNWDPNTHTAHITDGGNNVLLQQQLAMKEYEITKLKEKIDELEGKNNISIRDLENKIIKNHDSYKDVDFTIRLRGDDRKVDVEINVDLGKSRQRDYWDDLSTRDIERYIEEVVDDIQREYKDADVKGYIEDSDSRDKLYSFDKRSSGKISIDEEKTSKGTKDIERDLERKYSSDLKGIKNMKFTVKNTRKDDYEFTVELDYDKYEDEWHDLSNSTKDRFLSRVADYIEDNIRDAKVIEGEIVKKSNGKNLYYY